VRRPEARVGRGRRQALVTLLHDEALDVEGVKVREAHPVASGPDAAFRPDLVLVPGPQPAVPASVPCPLVQELAESLHGGLGTGPGQSLGLEQRFLAESGGFGVAGAALATQSALLVKAKLDHHQCLVALPADRRVQRRFPRLEAPNG
jgi:hypothetical protein